MSESRKGALLALIIAVAVTAVALWSVFGQIADTRRMPGVDTVVRGNAVIGEQIGEFDVVRVLPLWFDDGRRGLPTAHFFTGRELDDYERHRFDRMWLAYSVSHEDLAAGEQAWLANTETVFDEGGYRVVVGDIIQNDVVLWDGLLSLRDSRVVRETVSGATRSCRRWMRGGYHCGRWDEWVNVSQSLRVVDDQTRECIYMGAPPDGDAWLIAWDAVPMGSALRIRAGLTLEAIKAVRGSPVNLQVMINGEQRLDLWFGPDDFGYPEHIVDTASLAGETALVEIRMSAADYFDRFFCARPQTIE